jgi:hypothetical protein
MLRDPVSTISHKAFGYANICFREGHILKAKKNLIHSIRFLLFFFFSSSSSSSSSTLS